MKLLPAPRSRRTIVTLVATAVVALLIAGIGAYGFLIGSREPSEPTGTVSSTVEPTTEPSHVRETPVLRIPAIPRNIDAEAFSRSVATALFTWDTGSGFLPLEYTAVILDVADPTSAEQPGLAADIATYLPTQHAWLQLRQYATNQYLEITSAYVPDAWADALAQARPDQLPEDATAFTIEGIRHRSGNWNGDQVSAEQEVAFTIFIACPPDGSCYVLRLSQLNNPLR
ncbi:hypothetical protein ESZ53_01410 [Salinibacterium sp. UTAS2018]|uniref:hypothetical protein n=1 Tax=Salinibacterium sp. UTAS2018 TaxID=2508880 RepID=UPI001009429A|nr:hypothetical protein [Salinibacterium sp. UTAS2018]QAV69215.1 hypothetical protein ESZ53_01410 [Salinibacterium sp. UTAS2018]